MKWISKWISNSVLLLTFLSFASSAAAQLDEVQDPQKVLAQVDAFLGVKTFEETFPCDSRARYFAPVQKAELTCEGPEGKDCSGSYQLVETAEGDSTVANCTADSISIYPDSGVIMDISRELFEAQGSSMPRIFLSHLTNFLGHPGFTRIESLTPAEYTLASGAKLPALHINGRFYLNGGPGSFELLITVVKGAPGVAQIARVRLGNQTWIRLKEFQ